MRIFLYDKDSIEDGYETIRKVCKAYALMEGNDFFDSSTLKALESAVISRTRAGKPYFRDISGIHFSISHSGGVWACAVDREPLGFDIEKKDRFYSRLKKGEAGTNGKTAKRESVEDVCEIWNRLAKRFFTAQEHEFVSDGGDLAFLQLWVRKEAYLKYRGSGLSGGLDRIDMVSEGRLVSEFSECYIQEINVGDGLISAYCAGKKRTLANITDNRV